MTGAARPVAFILMPFAPSFDDALHELLEPALCDFDVIRADTRLDERNILAKIATGIHEADLVVADVTGTNSNVMYELGAAHAMGKVTLMVAETVIGLPFDIRSYPVHEYGAHRSSRPEVFIALLRETARRCVSGELLYGNPFADFLPHLKAMLSRPPTYTYSVVMCTADLEQSAEEIGEFFDRFNSATTELTRLLGLSTAKIGTGSSTPRDDIGIREAAIATRAFAQDIAALSSLFRSAWEKHSRAMRWLFAPEQRAAVGDSRLHGFSASARNSDASLDGLIEDLAELRRTQQHIPDYSGNFTHALEVVRAAISTLLNEVMVAKAYVAWLIAQDPLPA